MPTPAPNESGGNYFALPRLLRKIRGLNAARSECNWIEACTVGNAIFLITYLFAASLLWPKLRAWQVVIVLPLLLPTIWIAWLIVLYLNSLIVKGCWALRLFTDLARNRVQSVLMGIATTILAAQLMVADSWLRWIGLIWIAAVGLNLGAALILALFHEEPR
jgi:hypothetical protein